MTVTAAPEPRFAVYYAPPRESALWATAQRWLGRDCESDKALAPPVPDGWSAAEIAKATQSPRRYGFHATLKPPFRLAADTSENDLRRAFAHFAADQAPFQASPLQVSAIGPFLALTLRQAAPAMERLAAEAVRAFEPFRAPPTAEEEQRRLAKGVTARQAELLSAWGYPYVFEEFRFHMTLSGPLPAKARDRLSEALRQLFQPYCDEPFTVAEVCLYRQSRPDAAFCLIERRPFGRNSIDGRSEASQSDIAAIDPDAAPPAKA